MKFILEASPVIKLDAACLVIGAFDDAPLQGSAQLIDDASGGALQKLIDSSDVDTSWKCATMLHGMQGVAAKRILVMGCGEPKKFDEVRYDAVCTSAGAFLRDHATTTAHICLHEMDRDTVKKPASEGSQNGPGDTHWRLRQAAVNVDRANYCYTTTKKRKKDDNEPLASVSFNANEDMQAALDEARGLARGYLRSTELGNLPPNICTPAYLADIAHEIEDKYDNVSLDILEQDEMARLKMSALLAVGRGSVNRPRLIVLKYQGKDESSQPVVLVGKGITFDTGGISLKPGTNMEQMKFDMGGAASVIGAFEACADLQLPINLICVIAAAENMPDGNAYRPGDVLTSMSGKTIEVINTDAEGRLVLCDALTFSQRFEPVSIIDVATLTGACVIALGHHASAVMSKHDDLADELLDAGQSAVDRGWRLPLWDDYQPQLKSEFADMKNVGGMAAGSITAACFLSRFAEDQRWAHIDCAGSTWIWGGDKGSTGRPVGLLTQYLINQAG
ncbi:MAG: leucyl aminopeptidase [Xanthomonadales bacterium]|nr:leucyl aminopeptidase [Xanthomonadales bacterium]